jgi:predicted ester cyclase
MTPTSSESKQLIGRYLQAISGQTKTAVLVAGFVSDLTLQAHIKDVESAFPAYELIAEDLIAEGDRVAMRGVFKGVQRGPFAGIAASGRSVSVPLMIVYRVRDGRIAEHWMQLDASALIGQLQPA